VRFGAPTSCSQCMLAAGASLAQLMLTVPPITLEALVTAQPRGVGEEMWCPTHPLDNDDVAAHAGTHTSQVAHTRRALSCCSLQHARTARTNTLHTLHSLM
jgi:hypothetical protein